MRKREHVIPLRLNKKELAYLEKQVELSRMPREEYLRALVMGGEVRARPCTHHADLLRKVSGLCNNANQLAHVANSTGFAGRQSVDEMTRTPVKSGVPSKSNGDGLWHIRASLPCTAWTAAWNM